jgi:hypothetical protein
VCHAASSFQRTGMGEVCKDILKADDCFHFDNFSPSPFVYVRMGDEGVRMHKSAPEMGDVLLNSQLLLKPKACCQIKINDDLYSVGSDDGD